jgi:ABC-2 type transport system permease protein
MAVSESRPIPVRTTGAAPPGAIERARGVWAHRELLGNLVRKELKVKYKNSVLGFVWSLLNPALYLVVFSVVFQVFLKANIPFFGIYLLTGLLPWNLFANGLSAATGSITGNAQLVQKVSFPREILTLAAIGAALVHFFLQLSVLAGALLVFRHAPAWELLPLLLPALLVLILLVVAVGLILAAVNVVLRDTQHLLELALLAWFWLTPIVYPFRLVADTVSGGYELLMLNPVTTIVITFQRVLYNQVGHTSDLGGGTEILPDASTWWYLRNLGLVAAGSAILLLVALRVFGRFEDDFAEGI